MVHGGGHHHHGGGGGGGGVFGSHGNGSSGNKNNNPHIIIGWWHGGNSWGNRHRNQQQQQKRSTLTSSNGTMSGDATTTTSTTYYDDGGAKVINNNQTYDDGGDCERCCRKFGACMSATICCFWCCCRTRDNRHRHPVVNQDYQSQPYDAAAGTTGTNSSFTHGPPRRRRPCNWTYTALAGSAIVYWAILFLVAASYKPGDHRFTLNVGETWKIEQPKNLWSRTSLSVQSFGTNPGLEVYEILPVLDGPGVKAACPPLEGPMLMLREPEISMKLRYEEYQYDYFHLNAGSIITIDAVLKGKKGSTNIYILKGYDALASLEHGGGANTDFQNFRGTSILKRFLGNAEGQTEPHTHVEFTVPTSDFYIVVYDNASSGPTKLDVTVTVRLATHYLESQRPICTANETIHGCTWDIMNSADVQRIRSTCILVKAVSHKETRQEAMQKEEQSQLPGNGPPPPGQSESEQNIALELDDGQVVLVQVDAQLGSKSFILLACLPFLVLICLICSEENRLARFIRCLCCRGCGDSNDDGRSRGHQSVEETIPLKGAYPPPPSYNYVDNEAMPPAMAPPHTMAQAVLLRTETPEIHADGLVPIAPPRNYTSKSSWS
jgi:hypothetical protein